MKVFVIYDTKYGNTKLVAETVEEAKKLVEAGFEYVCSHNDTMLFRKRK